MRKSIILKLFVLTAGLCTVIIAGLFFAQTVFFKQFYVHQKVSIVQSALQAAAEEDWNQYGNARTAFALEQQFYQNANTWIARLDAHGKLKYTDNFELIVQLENRLISAPVLNEGLPREPEPVLSGERLTIPLYTVLNVEELRDDNPLRPDYLVTPGERIAIEGIVIDGLLYPQRIGRSAANLRDENRLENGQLIRKEYDVVSRFNSPTEYHEQYPSVLVYGIVEHVRLPEGAEESRYTNRLFLERVKAFQADLLYGDFNPDDQVVLEYEENNVPYKIFVNPLLGPDGSQEYLFAMTSLQPVNEAAEVARHYYGYIVLGTLLLVLLASFYYARRIARPLLRMNEATQKMASLDFSVRIPVKSEDEIGNLSASINELSDQLHRHIVQLEQDIEKEKRLEQTRKEFIAGVSHELKTPLSVIENCLYIIRDKPESEKRDYYFAAMEEELKNMNLLITDMLELAKYESGTYKMELVPFPIDSVLERVCEKMTPELAAKNLKLYTNFTTTKVAANPMRIEQVVVNFLSNAIRHTPEDGNIFIEINEQPETVQVCIENEGSHIPEDQLDKIWDRFYRGEHSRHRSTGGTGLGLAISKQILELHGSHYGVNNTENGVRFYFDLKKN